MASVPDHPSSTPPSPRAKNGHPGKPRHALPLTVQGERGLREGEVWLVNGTQVHFFTGEHLAPGRMYEARIDPRDQGGNVDIRVKIVQASVGHKSGVKEGYLHIARYRTKRSQDTRRLLDAFRKLNPELAPAATAPAPAPAPRPPAARPVAPAQTAESRPPKAKAAPEPSPRKPAKRPEPKAAPSQPRRTATDSIYRVIPQIGPGTPPAVLLHFPDAMTLRTHMRIEQGDVFLYGAPTQELAERQGVLLHLQLPTGRFVSALGRVMESTDRRCSFVLRRADAAVLNSLNAALRISATD